MFNFHRVRFNHHPKAALPVLMIPCQYLMETGSHGAGSAFERRCHQLSHSNKMGRTDRAASRARHELVESVMLIVLHVISATLGTDRFQIHLF